MIYSHRMWLFMIGVPVLLLIAAGITAFLLYEDVKPLDDPRSRMPRPLVHTDHATFFTTQFADGPAVTRACLECHEDSARQVMRTAHWNWVGEEVPVPGHEQPMRIGKKNLINNFCIGVQSNWPRCTVCHIGYGWEDERFDFTNHENVDCLVCHDQSGIYDKGDAGLPKPGVDLLVAARSVASPQRANCGFCHFSGGGGDAVKHGDLDATLLFPSERIDIHMSRHNLQCIDCHHTVEHNIPGRSMSVSVDNANRIACTDCHIQTPHDDARLNAHVTAVACQTCHIPKMAVEEATKIAWDWSAAGDLNLEQQLDDEHKYLAIKGKFEYAAKLRPDYAWYNGFVQRYIAGDKIEPEQTVIIAAPLGDVTDPAALIWPFKIHRGKQIYDREYRYLLVPKVFGPGGYWTEFNWDLAARLGSEKSGLRYSGAYDFASTIMYWPLSHMVAPKNQTLACDACHGPEAEFDWKALGYLGDPVTLGNRDRQGLLSRESDRL